LASKRLTRNPALVGASAIVESLDNPAINSIISSLELVQQMRAMMNQAFELVRPMQEVMEAKTNHGSHLEDVRTSESIAIH